MGRKALLFSFFIGAFVISSSCAYRAWARSETVTMESYFPVAASGSSGPVGGNKGAIGTTYKSPSTMNALADNNFIVEGNVGIGTTMPETKLYVKGDALTSGTLISSTLPNSGFTGYALNLASIGGYGLKAGTTHGLSYHAAGSFMDAGFFDVINQGTLAFRIGSGVDASYGLYSVYIGNGLYPGQIGPTIQLQTNKSIVFDNTNVNLLRFDKSGNTKFAFDFDTGNVGIGTTNPTDRLEIAGGGIMLQNGQGIRAYSAPANSGAPTLLALTNNNDLLIGGTVLPNLNNIMFRNGRVVISPTGNVGIGTTSPQTLLQVNDTKDPTLWSTGISYTRNSGGSGYGFNTYSYDSSGKYSPGGIYSYVGGLYTTGIYSTSNAFKTANSPAGSQPSATGISNYSYSANDVGNSALTYGILNSSSAYANYGNSYGIYNYNASQAKSNSGLPATAYGIYQWNNAYGDNSLAYGFSNYNYAYNGNYNWTNGKPTTSYGIYNYAAAYGKGSVAYGIQTWAQSGGTSYGIYSYASGASTSSSYAGYFVGNVYVQGTLTASTKNFQIPHPLRPGYQLVHSSLEGPESAVFYRGAGRLKNGQAQMTLPGYFEALTRKEGRTVQLTAKGAQPYFLSYTEIVHGTFKVYGTEPEGEFSWEVKAIRADVAPLQVEKPTEPQPAPSKLAPPAASGHASS